MKREIWFDKLTRSQKQISMTFGFNDLRFEVAYWYNDVDLHFLEEKYGQENMNKIYFHIMAFEINKLVSLQPKTIDLGDYARFHTEQFESFWQKIVRKIWVQWRYENNLPHYKEPEFISNPVESQLKSIENQLELIKVLSFCGGGKDSLVAMKLLERARIPYSLFAYSSSVYGTQQHQHDLIKRLLKHGTQCNHHALWVFDSFIDSPVLQLYPQYTSKSIKSAETPSSIFGSLPIVLQHGYHHIALGHERSADAGNLIWEETGEEVNHQWGKSFEAEVLINNYIQNELISNFSYFSLLKPMYDVVIFNLLKLDIEGVSDTHSCSIQKPWCCKCAKCAYVWLNYMAYLPVDLVNSIFKTNLFDIQENQHWFYEMLGLGEHTPFECIGEISETRLAFELCRRKGLGGKAMDMYFQKFPNLDVAPILEKYLNIDPTQANIPFEIKERIIPQIYDAAKETRQYISQYC